ncbi:hypothetical protein DYB35_013402, partial [Aphanomyces astaci]
MYLTLVISTAYWRMSALRDAVVLPSKNELGWKALACACARIDARESVGLLHAVVAVSSVDRPDAESPENTLRISRCFRRMRVLNDGVPRQALLNYTLQTLICGCSRGECYWSSGPSSSQMQDDYIDYAVLDQCIVRAMELVPYKAFCQMGEPGYAPLKVSIALLAKSETSEERCIIFVPADAYVRITFHGKHQFEYDATENPRRYFCCISQVGVTGVVLEPPLTAKNYLLHKLYLRQEYAECLKLIEDMLKEHQGLCEYPIYVKVALIMQHSGRIQESLQLFQAATCMNPDNKDNLKQVGRSLYLLGKHKAAIEVFEETKKLAGPEDWEIHHNIGLCHMYLKSYDLAIESFQSANNIHRHDTTFLQLGKVHTLREDFKAAINVYLEALEFSPENPELLTTVGLLYLRIGENFRAFDYLGNSMTHDPRNAK